MNCKINPNPDITVPLYPSSLSAFAPTGQMGVAASGFVPGTAPKTSSYVISRNEAASALDHLIHTAVTPAPGSKAVRDFLRASAGQIGTFTAVLSSPLKKNPRNPLGFPRATYLFELSEIRLAREASPDRPAPYRTLVLNLKQPSTRAGAASIYEISPVHTGPLDGSAKTLAGFVELNPSDRRAFDAYADLARLFVAVQTGGSEPYTNALRRFSEFAGAKGRITNVRESSETGKIEFVKTVLEGMGPGIEWILTIIRCPDDDHGRMQFAVTLRKSSAL